MFAPPTVGAPSTKAVWTFSPRPRSRTSREEEGRVRGGLAAALRAGHGAGARFRVHVFGVAETSVLLSVDDGPSERWIERALLRAYEPGDWRRVGAPDPVGHPRWWSGRRVGLPGERAEPPLETGRLLRALAAAVRAGGQGTSVTVSFCPATYPRFRLLDQWLGWNPLSPPAERASRPRGAWTPTPYREPTPAAPGLTWSIAVGIGIGPSLVPGGTGRALAAVRSAWTALDGRPLRLRRNPRGPLAPFLSLLSDEELPGLLPSGDAELHVPLARAGPSEGIPVGRAHAGSVVSLPVEAAQGRHFAVFGETGMGKSSLLVVIARRAVAFGGVILLDPLGETAEALRLELRPMDRPVLWVAPGALGVGVNALAGIGSALRVDPVRAERELGDLVHALRRVRAGRYVDSAYWGPRLEEMLVRAVRAAASVPGGTLEDAHALLAGSGTRRSVVPPELREEVRDLATRVRDRPDDAEGARRLLYEIVRNPTLAGMLCCREPRLTIPDLVQPGTVVLVSGAASRVGESTARYLLAAYLALVWSELLGRTAPSKTFVLLDEAQWFAHEGLGEMLRLARRKNVHVGVATQSLATLPEEVRDAVRTNVADLVVFRGSPEEAHALGRTTSGVSAESLLALSRGEAAVLLGKGETVRWVRAARLPEPARSVLPSTLPTVPVVPPVAPGETGNSDPEEADTGPEGILADLVVADDRFLVELTERGRRLPPGELLEVDLADVRARGLADDRHLRAWGGTLGRRGAIVRTERRAGGPVWWLDPSVLGPALADRGQPEISASQKRL